MKQIFFGGLSKRLDMESPIYKMTLPKVTDISKQEGIRLAVELLEDGVTELEITLHPLFIARPEFFPEVKGGVAVAGKGKHQVEIPFGQFGFGQMAGAFLSYLDKVSVRLTRGASVVLSGMEADIMGDFGIRAKRTSNAGSAGEWLEYPVEISNPSEKRRLINVRPCQYGKECLPVDYVPYLTLEAGENREYWIRILVTGDLPEGGLEKSRFLFVPDGDGAKARQVELCTVAKRKHPYLVLDEKQWQRRREAILADAGLYKTFCAGYMQKAWEWEVLPPSDERDYVYPSYSQNALFGAAVAWKVTGQECYLKKALEFFRGLTDGENGYLATEKSYFEFIGSKEEYARGDFKVRRAQSAGWVQEAEFFNRAAMSYDLLYEHFTQAQREQIEACFRNYMEFVSWRLTDGDGNNFQIAESAAGALCAMALQDYGMVERFLYGYNGVFDLLSAVLLDDGMYFEEASGYVRLAGELFFDIANAAENFGISVKDVKLPASFDRNILHAPWAVRERWAEDGKPFLGMSFLRFEEFTRPTRCLKDYFDCTAKLLDAKGRMFSVNDSNEQDFTGLYQKAYYLYGDEAYKEIAGHATVQEVLFVRREKRKKEGSMLLSGAGFGILREDACQAVLKFGVHGGYHGHFDRLSLASFFSGDKTFHNNEYAWYGYNSFLFKMWVQTSVAHNMVVVDKRMQKPSPCQCVYYAAGEMVQMPEGGYPDTKTDTFSAVCAQTVTEWIDPPYGGQTPYPLAFPKEKCQKEGRYILEPEKARKQGEIGEYSEPVFQRRLLILFHGYCIVWDYLAGQQEHCYDCLYHPMGRFGNEGGLIFEKRARFSDSPFGAGQFIQNCHIAWPEGAVCLRFHEAQSRINPNDIMDFTPESAVWRAWPVSGAVTVGRYPQKTDRFTQEELAATAGFLQETKKKTVAFTVEGKCAEFITILEAGERTGRVRAVCCESFSSLSVTEQTGEEWEIRVAGMDCFAGFGILHGREDTREKNGEQEQEKISVEIHKKGWNKNPIQKGN